MNSCTKLNERRMFREWLIPERNRTIMNIRNEIGMATKTSLLDEPDTPNSISIICSLDPARRTMLRKLPKNTIVFETRIAQNNLPRN